MNFHQLNASTLSGKPFDFTSLAGKKVLVVNTASECGYTPQYAQLQELYEAFGGDGFQILAFPCNQFGAQEPGNEGQIADFCQLNYGVSFPMMQKVEVKGPGIHPVFSWLTQKIKNGSEDIEVSWNFQKFLIDENGRLLKSLSPETSPLDEQLIKWLEA